MIQANYRQAQGGFWAALIPALASLAGGIFQQNSAKKAAETQMNFQQGTLNQQQAFADTQSSTAHQREVKDLRAAGLNPVLSGTGGMGSASPQVSGMPGATYKPENIGEQTVNSALAARRNNAEVKEIEQRVGVNLPHYQQQLWLSEHHRNTAAAHLDNQRSRVEQENERRLHAEADLSQTMASRAASDWKLDSSEWNRLMREAQPTLNSASSLFQRFSLGGKGKGITINQPPTRR